MAATTALVGATLVSGAMASKSANKAAKAGLAASNAATAAQTSYLTKALEEERRQYDQARADNEPFREVGTKAVGSLADMAGLTGNVYDITKTPGYEFRLSEGEKAIKRSQAYTGKLGSGETIKEMIRFNQNTASDEFGTQFNRLAQLAGMTPSNPNSNVSNIYAKMGDASSQGTLREGDIRYSMYDNKNKAVQDTIGNAVTIGTMMNSGNSGNAGTRGVGPYAMSIDAGVNPDDPYGRYA